VGGIVATGRVVIGGNTIGIVDLEDIFNEVKAAGLKDSELIKNLIMDKTKIKNYIPSKQELLYRADLYEEYLVFTGELPGRKSTSSALRIRLYGASCSRCEEIDAMLKKIFSRRGLRADYQYITDIKEIARSGIFSNPALTVNGKVILSGRSPSEKELEKIIADSINS
jgi:small redox-active disulfide protein 2